VEGNRRTPFVVGVGAGSSVSFSELDLRGNETLQSVTADTPAVLIRADYAKIRACNAFTYNPNVFTEGWISTTPHTGYVMAECPPTDNFPLNRYPFAATTGRFYGWGPNFNLRVGGLALPDHTAADSGTTVDFNSGIADTPAGTGIGSVTVESKDAAWTVQPPAHPLDGQFYVYRVKNSTAGPQSISFAPEFAMDSNRQNLAPARQQTWVFRFLPGERKPWVLSWQSPVVEF